MSTAQNRDSGASAPSTGPQTSKNPVSGTKNVPSSQPGADGDSDYPDQRHAGQVGYGPNYQAGPSLEDKVRGLKDEIMGKITHNPDLVQHGKDIRSGEEKRRKQNGEDESSPFETAGKGDSKSTGGSKSQARTQSQDHSQTPQKQTSHTSGQTDLSQSQSPSPTTAKTHTQGQSQESPPSFSQTQSQSPSGTLPTTQTSAQNQSQMHDQTSHNFGKTGSQQSQSPLGNVDLPTTQTRTQDQLPTPNQSSPASGQTGLHQPSSGILPTTQTRAHDQSQTPKQTTQGFGETGFQPSQFPSGILPTGTQTRIQDHSQAQGSNQSLHAFGQTSLQQSESPSEILPVTQSRTQDLSQTPSQPSQAFGRSGSLVVAQPSEIPLPPTPQTQNPFQTPQSSADSGTTDSPTRTSLTDTFHSQSNPSPRVPTKDTSAGVGANRGYDQGMKDQMAMVAPEGTRGAGMERKGNNADFLARPDSPTSTSLTDTFHSQPNPSPRVPPKDTSAGMGDNGGYDQGMKEQAATVAPERDAEMQRKGNNVDFVARPVDARQ